MVMITILTDYSIAMNLYNTGQLLEIKQILNMVKNTKCYVIVDDKYIVIRRVTH